MKLCGLNLTNKFSWTTLVLVRTSSPGLSIWLGGFGECMNPGRERLGSGRVLEVCVRLILIHFYPKRTT